MSATMSSADAATLFDASRLTLARQLTGMRKSELAKTVGKSATAVTGWEAGTKRPAAATVAELALALGVEPGFFAVRQDIADLSGPPHFRSLRSTSQLARDQAFAYGQLTVDIASSLERNVEFPDLDLISFPVDPDDPHGDGPEQAAQALRDKWGIVEGPIRHMVRLLENHGILVVFSPPAAAAVDAYSFETGLRPVVVLNPTKHDYYRQRFDVAHELGHLVMHSEAEPGERIVEEQAHRFAAELLMPADQIRDLLPTTMGGNVWGSLAQLKEQWGVSMQALLFRARRLGQLGDVSYRNAMTTISSRGWRRHEPGQIEILEQPSLLPRAVEVLEQEGIDEGVLLSESRVPAALFHAITSRTPAPAPTSDQQRDTAPEPNRARVISLLPKLEQSKINESSEPPLGGRE